MQTPVATDPAKIQQMHPPVTAELQHEQEQYSKEITLSLIKAKKPKTLSKSFTMDPDGSLVKQSGGALAAGTVRRLRVTLTQFVAGLSAVTPHEAFIYGVADPELAIIVTQDALQKVHARGSKPVIARDRNHFQWSQGPGMQMLDYDPPPKGPALSQEELLRDLYQVWPELKHHPHIWCASASSCIYRTDTGEELRGVMGQRVYVPVQDASDIPRSGVNLYLRLWLAGHGRVDVSKSGALLERTIIDGAVWQSERLDFAGGARCGPGLEQRRPDPVLYNPDAPFINTRETMPELADEDKRQYQENVLAARKKQNPEVKRQREAWIEERIHARLENVPDDQKDTERRRQQEVYRRAVVDKVLLADFRLQSQKHGEVTVGEILDNSDKFHDTRFSDPLEPGYGNDPRIAVANLKNGSKPSIYSHAHGGQRFTLSRRLQTIKIENGELPRIVKDVLGLMRLDGSIFERGGELVRLSDGSVLPVTPEYLSVYLTGLARFEKFDKRAKGYAPVDFPDSMTKKILAMAGCWDLPKLEGIITLPIITPSGRIIATAGHDAATGLYLDLGDVSAWVDKGGYFSGLLSASIHPAIPTAPAVLIPSPSAGSGKTLLAQCLAALAGTFGEVIPYSPEDEEMRKRLLSLARICSPVVILDNVSGTFESNALCAFLTCEYMTDRVLGSSTMISVRTNSLVVITGNNPVVCGDLNRRLIHARINPRCEKPFLRTFDLDPLEYVRRNRLNMVRAALTILKASISSGFRHDKGRLASFEVWSDFVRNAVIWVGKKGFLDVADPVESIAASYTVDPETRRLESLLAAWSLAFGKNGGTVPQAIARATAAKIKADTNARINATNATTTAGSAAIFPDDDMDLYLTLEDVAGDHGRINPRMLGRWIERHVGRIVDGRYFERKGTNKDRVVWAVVGERFERFERLSRLNAENCQSDKLYTDGKQTVQTVQTDLCHACVNFAPNDFDPQKKPGACRGTPGDGRYTKMPSDGAGCPSFGRVMH